MTFSDDEVSKGFISNFLLLIQNLENFLSSENLSEVQFLLKKDGSPVSDLDVKIENFVRSQACSLLPKFQLIGEESELPTFWAENYLVVDPIDGTENFVSGIPIWGIGLALIINNKLVASWIHFPEISMSVYSQELRERLTVPPLNPRKPLGKTRVRGYSSNTNWNVEGLTLAGEVRVFGCSLFNILLASQGAIHYKSSTNGVRIWDILPSALIALESGRRVLINGRDYHGEFLDPNFRYMVEIEAN